MDEGDNDEDFQLLGDGSSAEDDEFDQIVGTS
jgi:hypothetical protein